MINFHIPEWFVIVLFFVTFSFMFIAVIIKFVKGRKFSKKAEEFRKNLKNNDLAVLHPGQYSTFSCIVSNIKDDKVDITIKDISKDFLYHK